MNFVSQEILERLRKRYLKGTKVRLVKMNDPYRNMPEGLEGIVKYVDDAGTIHVNWENGSSLGVVYGEDEVEII